jgi:hypothetical protein
MAKLEKQAHKEAGHGEVGIIFILLKNLGDFKVSIKQKIKNKSPSLEDLDNTLPKNETYISNNHEFLKLIGFIYSNTDEEQKMGFMTMNTLWENFIVNALVPEEKDLFFR